MSNHRHIVTVYGANVTPEVIEAAIQRGRRERSKAFWSLLEALFGRPGERGDAVVDLDDRSVHGVR